MLPNHKNILNVVPPNKRFFNKRTENFIFQITHKQNSVYSGATNLMYVAAVEHQKVTFIISIHTYFGTAFLCQCMCIWKIHVEIVTTVYIKICMIQFLRDQMSSITSNLYEGILKTNESHINHITPIVPCKTALIQLGKDL